MSNQKSIDTNNSILVQNHSPHEPFYSLDAFYETLLSKKFQSNTEAINFCRNLCSDNGFTVKQEQSTHRNIYVYCSREGLPDSHRNPRINPQRNRQSQRCECRWRIVLYENNKKVWEFRKSQNTDAYVHNHSLLKPEEIKKEWPREVSEKIFELARKRLPTNEIRQQVREQYPNISWDDRRFYNRLSEERQKMKQRDTAMRTIRLINLCSQICMVNAGNEDLSHYVESRLLSILEDTCKFSNMSPSSVAAPISTLFPSQAGALEPTTPTSMHSSFSISHEDIDNSLKRASSIKQEQDTTGNQFELSSGKSDETNNSNESKKPSSVRQKKSFEALPKGYLAVPIPEYTLYVKTYGQNSIGDIRRAIFDVQRTASTTIPNNPLLQYTSQHPRELRQRRSRAQFTEEEDESMDLDSPARKLSRQVTSTLQEDDMDDMSINSSPSNSQIAMLHASSNNPDVSTEQQQQQAIMEGNYNTYTVSQIPSSNPSTEETNVFFSHNTNNASVSAHNSLTPLPQTSFHPSPSHVYPPINTGKFINRQQPRPKIQPNMLQPMIYNPNSYLAHPQQDDNIQLFNSAATSQVNARPHSMNFGTPISSLARAHSISVPGISSINQHALMRPTGYHPSLTQMQHMNDGKQRFYGYNEPIQPSLPPRPASTTNLPSSSSHDTQHYMTQPQGNDMFNSSFLSSTQQHATAIFPNPYITSGQLLEEQDPKTEPGYHETHQFYRRASGPN